MSGGVVLVTGVTIKAAWFDGIAARLARDGFRTVMYEPPGLLSGDLFQASKELDACSSSASSKRTRPRSSRARPT
jgi:hypothetical protein